MRHLFFLIFGMIGLVITCIEGLEPLIEVSLLVSWVTKNWLEWSRAIWSLLFSFLSINLPVIVADIFNAIIYTFSTIIGLGRIKVFGYSRFLSWAENLRSAMDNIPQRIPKIIRFILETSLSVTIFLPYLILFILLFRASYALGAAYLGFSYLLVIIDERTEGKIKSKIYKKLFGDLPVEQDDTIAFSYLTVPAYALIILLVVLCLNELAIYGANITTFVEWIRCEAKIECLPSNK